MFGLGTTELIVILVIVLIIFGVGRLPEIGGALGKSIKNFKNATDGEIDVTPSEKKSAAGRKGGKGKKHAV